MSIKILIGQLRRAADSLEALLTVSEAANETPAVAKAIRKDIKRSYHGKHWTQTKKGKAVIAKRSKEMWAAKKKQERAEQDANVKALRKAG